MNRVVGVLIIMALALGGIYLLSKNNSGKKISEVIAPIQNSISNTQPNPLSIQYLRNRSYSGSDVKIEQTLADGANFHQYIASYQSDGLRIYALLLVPKGQKPVGGWPVILFNHGYIPPEQYQTTARYVAYEDAFANAGYIVFKPDYRGNGKSEGTPGSAYYSANYVIDDLNALASIKKYSDANSEKVGIYGHSLGGNLTLKDLVIRPNDVKAAVIWGGVVGTYNDLINNWQSRVSYHPATEDLYLRNLNRQNLISQYGTPESNPTFWNSIDPRSFVGDIKAPVQLDVGGADNEVPPDFSKSLYDQLQSLGKTSEYYVYPGSDHNISQGFNLAMQRSITFFDRYLK